MTDDNKEATAVRVGDLVPTWILDDDGTLVGVTMARVIGISDEGEAELDYPAREPTDTQPLDNADAAAE